MTSKPPSDRRGPSGDAAPGASPLSIEHMLRLTLAEITSANIRTLARYWENLRGGRRFPRKTEIDPAQIKPLLPYLILAEYHHSPLRIRYRLVGTEQARFAGLDFTGRWLHEIGWPPEFVRVWTGHVAEMIETGLPIFGRDALVWTDGKRKECEWAILPFSQDGATVTHGLSIEDFSTIERRRVLPPP